MQNKGQKKQKSVIDLNSDNYTAIGNNNCAAIENNFPNFMKNFA